MIKDTLKCKNLKYIKSLKNRLCRDLPPDQWYPVVWEIARSVARGARRLVSRSWIYGTSKMRAARRLLVALGAKNSNYWCAAVSKNNLRAFENSRLSGGAFVIVLQPRGNWAVTKLACVLSTLFLRSPCDLNENGSRELLLLRCES